jgi:hypothetical protein
MEKLYRERILNQKPAARASRVKPATVQIQVEENRESYRRGPAAVFVSIQRSFRAGSPIRW